MPDPTGYKASLTINAVSFNDWLAEDGIKYSVIERSSRTVVALDGTEYRRSIKKDHLEVDLLDLPSSEYSKVEAAIASASPALVTYVTKAGVLRSSIPFYVSSPQPTAHRVIGDETYFSGISFDMDEK